MPESVAASPSSAYKIYFTFDFSSDRVVLFRCSLLNIEALSACIVPFVIFVLHSFDDNECVVVAFYLLRFPSVTLTAFKHTPSFVTRLSHAIIIARLRSM